MVLTPGYTSSFLEESANDRRRGYNVYSRSHLVGVTGRSKSGNILQMMTDNPFFTLDPFERFDMFKLSSYIFGFVTSRMNRISGTKWEVVPEKKVEDRLADEMKFSYSIYRELKSSMEFKHLMLKAKIYNSLRERLPDLLQDLSNFHTAMLRWKKRIQFDKMAEGDRIEDWLWHPNPQETFIEFVKKWVQDLMVHGADAILIDAPGNEMDNMYHLPGGSVVPLKEPWVGNLTAWAQILDSFESQIYFGDEMVWSAYYPTSSRAYPMVPLEALLNKVAESLLFDKKMAEEADGTKPVEKVVVFGKQNAIGDFDDSDVMGMDIEKQTRIEKKMMEVKKQAIATISGVGTASILDISKRDTIPAQMERQKMVREEAALVFNLSPMEANLGGGDNTSGRSTAEEQGEIDRSRGYWPIAFLIQEKLTRDIITRKFPKGYVFRFKEGEDEMAELQKAQTKIASGLFSVNQVRADDFNEMPFDGEEFDKPQGAASSEPDGSEQKPFVFAEKKR